MSGLSSLAWSTFFASILFAGLMVYRGTWREMRDPLLWKYSFFIALFIGVLLYSFYFIGLKYTTPGNAAILLQFQVFTSFLFFNVLRKEPITVQYKIGAVLMVGGAVIILGREWNGINLGDLLVLVGTLCAPIGNYFQQRAREIASSESIMFLRSVLSAIIIFPFAYFVSMHASFEDVRGSLLFLLVNGVLLLGLAKIFWIEGIHRVSVTKATALSSIGPLFTLFFAWLILHQAPTVWQLASLVPFVLGTLLLMDQIRFRDVFW